MNTERSFLDMSPPTQGLRKVCGQYLVMFTIFGVAAAFGAAVVVLGTIMRHHIIDDCVYTNLWALRLGGSGGAILGTLLYPAIISDGAMFFGRTRTWFLNFDPNNHLTWLTSTPRKAFMVSIILITIGIVSSIVFGIASGVLGLSVLYLSGDEEEHLIRTIIEIGSVSGIVTGFAVGILLVVWFVWERFGAPSRAQAHAPPISTHPVDHAGQRLVERWWMRLALLIGDAGITAALGAATITLGTKMLYHRIDECIYTNIWSVRVGSFGGGIFGILLYPAITSHGAILLQRTSNWFLDFDSGNNLKWLHSKRLKTVVAFMIVVTISIVSSVVFGISGGVLGTSVLYLSGNEETHFRVIAEIGSVGGVVTGLAWTIVLMAWWILVRVTKWH
ncbi:hypothetical protein BD410DRAFT_803298 [Rickenella mellea]|uniref:Uncharacterized protein n=1 Tax=Rickenella mellea TaxID=50990 RepID=A0A4Y7Q5R9_9AGAM|nr:hypothetical protein BD410DRAFT_803298 [Rickenella mellea]